MGMGIDVKAGSRAIESRTTRVATPVFSEVARPVACRKSKVDFPLLASRGYSERNTLCGVLFESFIGLELS